MSYNLIDNAKQLVSDEMISSAATLFSEEETNVKSALYTAIPALLSVYSNKAEDEDMVQLFASTANNSYKTGTLNKIASLFNKDSELNNKSSELLNSILPEAKFNTLSNLISQKASVKPSSAKSIISIAFSLINGLLGKMAATNNMSPMSLGSWLISQKKYFSDSLPADFPINIILQDKSANNKEKSITKAEKTQANWLWPLIIFILLAFAIWLFFGRSCSKKADKANSYSDSLSFEVKPKASQQILGFYDSINNLFIYNPGNTDYLFLPDQDTALIVGEFSTEKVLYNEIIQTDSLINIAKVNPETNWIPFTSVYFNAGTNVLTEDSEIQLNNIAKIIKSFPGHIFSIAAFTSNEESSIKNKSLSQDRANTVSEFLKKKGVPENQFFSIEGHGQEFPIADNTTKEGRALNQRISIKVLTQ